MVAAWIRALTGVGPSMASGSHTCNGNCALLPTAPTKTSMTAVVNREPPINPDWAATEISVKAVEPVVAEDDDPDEQSSVPDPRDDKCLYRGVSGRRFLEPVSDEQVGAQSDELPEDVELDEVRREHEPEHRCREQIEQRIVPGEAFVALHKSARVELDHKAHEAHDDEHHGGEPVDIHPHRKRAALAEIYPVHRELYGRPAAGDDAGHEEQGEDREDERDGHPEYGHVLGVLFEETSGEREYQEDQRRERRYGRDDQLLAYCLHEFPSSPSWRLLRRRSRSAGSGTRRAR